MDKELFNKLLCTIVWAIVFGITVMLTFNMLLWWNSIPSTCVMTNYTIQDKPIKC